MSYSRSIAALSMLWWVTFACVTAQGAVQIIVGPTPIPSGDAKLPGDITVVNENLAFALAVQSAVPYGVPRGALVDLAPVVKGKIGRDRVVFADFIPDHWGAWPNTYQHVDILERGPERVVIRTERDWGQVVITTVYTLQTHSDQIEIKTTMRNDGPGALPGLLSGLTLWPNSGFLFSVPGMEGVVEGRSDAAGTGGAALGAAGTGGAALGGAAGRHAALADWMAAYDADWAIALHAAYFDHVGDGSMDLYRLHSLQPGETRVFDGWLQVLPRGDLAPVVRAEIDRTHVPAGRIHGTVSAQGRAVDTVVVVEKHGKPYAWNLGHGDYDLTLPVGDYTLYATAKNFSQSRRAEVKITAGSMQTRDFHDLEAPGSLAITVVDARDQTPLDARIEIVAGQKPLVQFLGRQTFFTELDTRGSVDLPIAPGKYVLRVDSGGGFRGPDQSVSVDVAPGARQVLKVDMPRLFDPPGQHWYAADLHHHADQAEAVTPPSDLARAQLAAGLDLIFVSDHDSTVNHRSLQGIAERRGLPFIAGIELSPSWGHFNAYPLTLGQPLAIDTSIATVDEVFREARRQGAIIVQANHPFIPYGYLTSVITGVAPGGFNPGFDLIEINAAAPADDEEVLHTLWAFWNAGHHYYLGAGTDTHDVWNSHSGAVRTFAHVDAPLSAVTFAQALKAGHGYVTKGPLIFPSVAFGDELKVKPGEALSLDFDLAAVDGLKRVELIGAGAVVDSRNFPQSPRTAHAEFSVAAQHSTWYSVMVEDAGGKKAYTDPIWIDVVEWSGLPSAVHPN